MEKQWARMVCFVLALGAACWSASAHRAVAIGGAYGGPSSAVQLTDVTLSQVVYGYLPLERPQLWVALDVPEASLVRARLGVPAIDRLRTYRVQWALLGPDLPLSPLPVSIPSGLGATLILSSGVDDASRLHEPVTDTNSWIVGEATLHLPTGGRYYLVAWSATGIDGKAWIAVGEREAFGWRDLMSLRTVIESVRTFHEAGPDPRFVAAAKALFLAGISIIIALLALW